MHPIGSLVARYLNDGNLAAAERICRNALATSVDPQTALLGLALIARRLGLKSHEQVYLDKLANPFADKWRAILSPDHVQPARTVGSSSPRYLLACARGCGFWSDFSSVLGCYMLAYLTNRVPVSNWRGSACLYTDDYSHDAFIDFFEPMSDVVASEVCDETMTYFPDPWTASAIHSGARYSTIEWMIPDVIMSSADVVVCAAYISPIAVLNWIIPAAVPNSGEQKYLITNVLQRLAQPKPFLVDMVEAFIAENFGSRPFTAVHIRGTDKILENFSVTDTNNQILELCSREPKDRHLFLMTDDEFWVGRVQDQFGERVVLTDATRDQGSASVHHVNRAGRNRQSLGIEILLDCFIAVKATNFIGNGQSNVASVVDLLRYAVSKPSIIIDNNQLLEDREWGLVSW